MTDPSHLPRRRPRPVIVLAGRQRPHENFLLAVAIVTGAAYIGGAPPPGSITALLPGWAIRVWAIGLALHGVVGLVAVLIRGQRGAELEAGAMLIGTASLVWYALAVVPFGWRALFAAAVSIAWAAANMVRLVQIRRDLKASR